jgi:predicted phosphodiesterase
MFIKKIDVISDIHNNSWALKSTLNDIENKNVDVIFNLGDSLYGPLDPIGTYNLIIENNIKCISGNEDRLLLKIIKNLIIIIL